MFSSQALQKVLTLPHIRSILDVGAGKCEHSLLFAQASKEVTSIDIAPVTSRIHPNVTFINDDFMSHTFNNSFDCIWISHLLEHQLNVNVFLKKCFSILRSGGFMAITVPPAKHQIVGGHVTIWNAGLLLYNLILAGTSCRDAMIKKYGYNISVIVPYHPITLPRLFFDNGDIEKLADFFPDKYNFQGFFGDIKSLNWDD